MLTQAKASGLTSLARNKLLTQKWRKNCSRRDVAVSMASYAYKAYMDSSFCPNYTSCSRPSLDPFSTKLAKMQYGNISCFGLPNFKMVV